LAGGNLSRASCYQASCYQWSVGMKQIAVLGGVVAIGVGVVGLGWVNRHVPAQEAIAAETAAETAAEIEEPSSSSDHLHFSDFGFRFGIPQGYVVITSETQFSGSPIPIQHLEVWEQSAYFNRIYLPESPPILHILVFDNAQDLPLTDWKGELSEASGQPLTIAGQAGLAYGATGLYEADNVVFPTPDGRYVIRIRGEYGGAEDAIREAYQGILASFAFDQVAANGEAIDYSRLQQRLAAQDWSGADLETRAIFYRLWYETPGRSLYYDSPEFAAHIPCEDLQTIDRLWSTASQGRFGFKAQQQLWEAIAAETSDPRERIERFGQAVGWRRDTPWPPENPFGLVIAGTAWKLETDLNVTDPKVGQYPWAGISSDRLQVLLAEGAIGCGSCTTDAMYLVNARYYDYLPALFERVEACQCNETDTEEL